MSAFIVSEDHINAIVNYANVVLAAQGHNQFSDPQILGELLLNENVKSVNYRYEQDTATLEFCWKPSFKKVVSAVQMLKALRCLDYQSCEHPDYKESFAYKAIQELIELTITELPGYEEAQWEITKPGRTHGCKNSKVGQ